MFASCWLLDPLAHEAAAGLSPLPLPLPAARLLDARRMARNIEIKARCGDLAAARAVRALGWRAAVRGRSADRPRLHGRRGAPRQAAQHRRRPCRAGRDRRSEVSGVRASDYTVTPVRDEAAGLCLVPKGRPRVVVRKTREILLWDNVRVHLDTVDGLGSFLESKRCSTIGTVRRSAGRRSRRCSPRCG